jgi:O-antigen/teichoic acid export membrane protein
VLALVGGIFPIISALGTNDTLGKIIPGLIEEGEGKRADEYFITTLYIQIIILALLAIFSFILNKTISILFYKSVLPFVTMAIIIFFGLLQSLMILMNTMIRSVQHFGKLSIVRVTTQISSRILSVILFFVWHVNGLLLGMLLGNLIGFFMYCYFLRKHFKIIKPSINFMREIVQYSFPYYGAALLRFSVMNADRYFVGIFFHPEQLAMYHIANKIIDYAILAMNSMADPITAKLAQLRIYGTERMESIHKKINKYYALVYIPLCGLIIAFARPILELYGGAKYNNAAPIMMLLALGLMLMPFSGLTETFVFILGKPIERFKIRLFSGVFSLLGAYGLMKMMGVNGLALSKVVSFGIYIIVGLVLLKKYMKPSIDKKNFYNVILFSFPIIVGGLVIQFFYYKLYISGIYFVLVLLGLLLFYIHSFRDSELGIFEEIIPVRFQKIFKRIKI